MYCMFFCGDQRYGEIEAGCHTFQSSEYFTVGLFLKVTLHHKGAVYPKLSSFTHPHVFPNP